MSKTTEWNEEELTEFDKACARSESHDQLTRISGRIEVRALVGRHGKGKCDAMFAELLRREKEGK